MWTIFLSTKTTWQNKNPFTLVCGIYYYLRAAEIETKQPCEYQKQKNQRKYKREKN